MIDYFQKIYTNMELQTVISKIEWVDKRTPLTEQQKEYLIFIFTQ